MDAKFDVRNGEAAVGAADNNELCFGAPFCFRFWLAFVKRILVGRCYIESERKRVLSFQFDVSFDVAIDGGP